MGGTVSSMVMRAQRGVDVVFEAPRWSERWVLEDDATMPESREHEQASALLKDILRAWIARLGRDALAGGNLALRWDRAHPKVGVDPDVYLVEPAPPDARLQSLRTWVKGHHAPRVAVEVVSAGTAQKDYAEGPAKYAASGTRELWIFDPEGHGRGTMGESWVLQVWRRTRAGAFRREYAGDGPAYSDELAAWLVVTDEAARLRVADDEAGARLWPTEAEVERAAKESERELSSCAEQQLGTRRRIVLVEDLALALGEQGKR